MDSNYVGRFGDTLRRLTALDAQAGAFSPQQVGGADTAGAFTSAAPAATQGAAPVQAPVGPPAMPGAPTAFSGSAAPTPAFSPPSDESGAMGQDTPISWGDVHDAMPDEHKNTLADHIEQIVGGNLKSAYRKLARSNGIIPKSNAGRASMAKYIAEVALGFAANRGSSQSNGEALAKGMLGADQHREATAFRQEQEARKDAEQQHQEDRQDQNYARGRADSEADYSRNRADTVADSKTKFEHDKELEAMRLKAEQLRGKGQDTYISVDDQGYYTLIDRKTGNAVPVTKEVDETVAPAQGSRGQGTTPAKTRKVRKPVKALPKANAAGLDQDTVLKKIEEAAKAMRGDSKLRRSLKAQGMDDNAIEQEIQVRARDQVQKDVQSMTGVVNPGADGTVTDFSSLK